VGSSSLVVLLKAIADEYPVRLEVKGCSDYIRPDRLVVTCQWDIHEFFQYLPENGFKPISDYDYDAIFRRFRQI
jgi:hypothetical protein